MLFIGFKTTMLKPQIDFRDGIVKTLPQKDPMQTQWSYLKLFQIIKVLPFIYMFI